MHYSDSMILDTMLSALVYTQLLFKENTLTQKLPFPFQDFAINGEETNPRDVHEKELLQIMCAYRLLMPFASITISTRERSDFRNNAVNICATKISAGVSVGIGGHSEKEKGDEQFEISDPRSVDEVVDALHQYGLQPSFNDYIRLI